MKFVGFNVPDHLAELLNQRVTDTNSSITKVAIAALEKELDPDGSLTLIDRIKNIEEDIQKIIIKLDA